MGWSKAGMGFLESLRRLHPWRCSKPGSPQHPALAAPALRRGVGLESLSNLSNATILCKHQNGCLKEILDTEKQIRKNTGQKLQYYLLRNSFSEKAEKGRKPVRWFLDEVDKIVKGCTRHNCL